MSRRWVEVMGVIVFSVDGGVFVKANIGVIVGYGEC